MNILKFLWEVYIALIESDYVDYPQKIGKPNEEDYSIVVAYKDKTFKVTIGEIDGT